MKKLFNILSKVIIFSMILVMVCPMVAHAEMTEESKMKYYDKMYSEKMVEFEKERGLSPTENLKGVVKEEIKFEKRLHYANPIWADGVYEVEIWDRNTSASFEYIDYDYYYLNVGAMYKNEKGELVICSFDDLIAGRIVQDLVNQHGLTKTFIKIPNKELQPVNGQTEIYGYIMYGYDNKALSLWDTDETTTYDNSKHLKLFKFDVTEKVSKSTPVYETATPTTSKIIVDGKEVVCEAYNIKGNNYFKLRDIASSVKDSERPFNIVWNAKLGIVEMYTFNYYVSNGIASKGDGKVKTATLNPAPTYIDFDFKNFTVYNIGGNNYFKLRDICEALDYGLTWDGVNNVITIDTNTFYSADNKSTSATTETKAEPKVEAKPEVKQEAKPETATGDISTYIHNGNKNVLKKEYARQFDLALIDNVKCTVNDKGELTLTITAPMLPEELKDFRYNVAVDIKTKNSDNKETTIRFNKNFAQGETYSATFDGYKFVSIMLDVATETTTMDVLQRHIISSDYKNTVFEQNFDSTGTVELTKDLSSIFGK